MTIKYPKGHLSQPGIYAIVHRDSGKKYIGSTATSFKERFANHKCALRHQQHVNQKLQNAWNKYSETAFDFLILEIIPKEEWLDNNYVIDIEQMWFDCYQPEYNIYLIAGNYLGNKHSEETRIKISNSRKGKRKGITFSEEHKAKIGAAHKGKTVSEETRKKLSEINKGKKYALGLTRSEETRKKLSESKKGKVRSEESKQKQSKSLAKYIYTLTSPEGKVFTTHSLQSFAKENGLTATNLYQVLKKKIRHSQGWHSISKTPLSELEEI